MLFEEEGTATVCITAVATWTSDSCDMESDLYSATLTSVSDHDILRRMVRDLALAPLRNGCVWVSFFLFSLVSAGFL